MKVCLAAFALTAIAWLPLPAHAIDCARASRPIEHMICGSQDFLRVDTAMSRGYAATLAAAPNPDIHAMLVTSQRRWIAALDLAFTDIDKASEDRTGGDFMARFSIRILTVFAAERRTGRQFVFMRRDL